MMTTNSQKTTQASEEIGEEQEEVTQMVSDKVSVHLYRLIHMSAIRNLRDTQYSRGLIKAIPGAI